MLLKFLHQFSDKFPMSLISDKKYSDVELEHWIGLASEEFYKLVYKDEWLSKVFEGIDQKFITNQQTDFMLGLFGGPKRYSGRNAKDAHPHIFITEQMWIHRESLLKNAFRFINMPSDLQLQWLKIDEAFKKSIVMKDPSECQKRTPTDDLIIVYPPDKKQVA